MRIFKANHPKTRLDSAITAGLSPAEAADFASRLDHGLPHREAAEWLFSSHGIRVSESTVSRWAARRRREKSERTFARLLAPRRIRRRAQAIDDPAGNPEALMTANLRLLTEAVADAHAHDDRYGMIQAGRLFAEVLEARANLQRRQTATFAAANRQRQREREAVARSLACADVLAKINASRQLDRRTKLSLASDCLFGCSRTASGAPTGDSAHPAARTPQATAGGPIAENR